MSDFLKNNPIALQQCFLYEFLRGKSFETTHTQFCRTVGITFTRTTRERNFIWFDQFGHGKFDDNQKPLDNIVDILRDDKQALRVCALYEWLNAENTRSKDPYLENEALPVFAKYQNFCKAIGDEVMEYQEFDFWFYRFANGMFDLKFERDKNQKILELTDMPLDIMKNVVEYLDIIDRMSLERTSPPLRLFSQDQKLFHPFLKLDVYDNSVSISFEKEHRIHYEDKGNHCVMTYRGRIKVLRGVSYLKQSLQDFKKILENPKLYLHTLTISSWRGDPVSLEEHIEDALKFTNMLHVKHISFRKQSMKTLLNILQFPKPGYLTRIAIYMNPDEATIGKIVEMEQWKQAKYLYMSDYLFVGPLRHLYHFHKFSVVRRELFIDDVREMKKILFGSPDFEKCTVCFDIPSDPVTIMQEFGGPIQGSGNICHYPIANSTDYFEIELERYTLRITRKKK